MLKPADAKAQEKHRKLPICFSKLSPHHHNLQRKTLIAWDAILILAKLASKTIQQLGYGI
jgi:hypothetical protein